MRWSRWHRGEELARALEAGANIVGINNRDLAAFGVDLSVTERLSEDVPDDVVLAAKAELKAQTTSRA